MPIFEIQDANGDAYEVDAPDENAAMQAFSGMDSGQDIPSDQGQLGDAMPSAEYSQALQDMSAATQNPSQALYDQLPWYSQAAVAADDIARIGANGLTFGYADKLAGYLSGNGTEQERIATDAARQRAGWAGTAADVGSSIAVPLGAAKSGATLVGRLGTSSLGGVGGVAARSGLATAEGAGYGALTASGYDQDIGEGAALGALFGLGGNAIGEGVQGIINNKALRSAIPSIEDLKEKAAQLYGKAEARGVVATGDDTSRFASSIKEMARNEELVTPKGRTSTAYPRAGEALNLLEDYAGSAMNPKQMQVVRETLADARNSTQGKERRIASKMLSAFDDFVDPLAPELKQARKVSQRYIKAEQLEKMKELGDVRASQYSQSGTENAMRTEYRQLDRQITKGKEGGWSPAEIEAIRKVSRGDTAQNIARYIGKLAPTGPVSFGVSAGVPFYIGNAIAGPATGATAAAITSGIGYAGKSAATALQRRNINIAEMLARAGGELPDVSSDTVRNAIVRSLIGAGSSLEN